MGLQKGLHLTNHVNTLNLVAQCAQGEAGSLQARARGERVTPQWGVHALTGLPPSEMEQSNQLVAQHVWKAGQQQ
ncbi:hypothetical protein KFL_002920170 [Klebsormidium nitens]|uniref:Uncharacterized protein n=1 Tax=Klebsormidium nitens TaxID=105231 RepID=A0A1Y1IBM4_KLENI|nr:hypothetical protein KFL_002920170 [Klebsormidium nitens]|eukprot:GAQ86501.1 hypothetical protein KFL_002920170 [Klebsormidium nitens]